MGRDHKEACEAESSIGDCSSNSIRSSSSSELNEDASSSSLSFACSASSSCSGSDHSASPLNNGDGPLFEFSELMAHLPIKRGLSKFYEGKSQSFTSLATVRSIEDLAKEENPIRKRLKFSKSCEDDLDRNLKSPLYNTNTAISSNASRVVLSPFSMSSRPRKARSRFLSLHRSRNQNVL